jgi:large subunit ribosomal protein L10
MNKEEKNQKIIEISEQLASNNVLYLADMSAMTVEQSNNLRRLAYSKNVSVHVVKNSLLQKAMEKSGKSFDGLYSALKGNTAMMISETGNVPAKLIKDFRKSTKKPLLKAAYIDEGIYLGDDQLEILVNLKSKDELIGDIIMLLQSPAKNVVSALQSSGQKLSGILKTLSEKN